MARNWKMTTTNTWIRQTDFPFGKYAHSFPIIVCVLLYDEWNRQLSNCLNEKHSFDAIKNHIISTNSISIFHLIWNWNEDRAIDTSRSCCLSKWHSVFNFYPYVFRAFHFEIISWWRWGYVMKYFFENNCTVGFLVQNISIQFMLSVCFMEIYCSD